MSFNWWVDEESCEIKRSSFFSMQCRQECRIMIYMVWRLDFMQSFFSMLNTMYIFSAITCDMLGVDCKCSLNAGSCNNADSNSVCNSASNKCVCKSGYEANENGVCVNINGKSANTWSLLSNAITAKKGHASWTHSDAILYLPVSQSHVLLKNHWCLLARYCICNRCCYYYRLRSQITYQWSTFSKVKSFFLIKSLV